MKTAWGWLGTVIFWALWPFLYLNSRLASRRRSRVLVIVGDEVLLVKNWINAGELSLPGGGTKRHESTRMSAVRELTEEVGITTPESNLVRIGARTKAQRGIKISADYYCVELSEKPRIAKQKLEIQDVLWAPVNEAGAYRLGEDVKFALKRYKPAEQASLL